MKENKRNRVIGVVLMLALVVSFIFLAGCSNTTSNSAILNISNTMTKISSTLDNVQDINNSDLIIKDFMSEDYLKKVDTEMPLLSSTDSMNNYILKISSLNNNVISTIEINDSINALKSEIYERASVIKSLCTQIKELKKDINQSQNKALLELNNALIGNITRVSLTRNEITNNYKNVDNLKAQYSSKTNQLNSRYTKLKNSLNTRLSYYNNLVMSLDDVYKILTQNFDAVENFDVTHYETPKVEDNEKKPIKTGITKNIDTYENAGTNIYGDYRNNPYYNPDNYLKNYTPGYGMMGPNYGGFGSTYSPYGYGMNGFGNANGMYGYGMMPYYNGYMFPNINTFGTYKNIDTYRSRKDLNKQVEDNDELTSEKTSYDRNYPKPTPQPMPLPYGMERKSQIELNEKPKPAEDEDQFVSNQEHNVAESL